MRLWSLHPSFLDAKGLVALWREALLAQHVLHGKTKGYRHHPQLQRFHKCKYPKAAIATYLADVQKEAARRGYNFNKEKILEKPKRIKITVTEGQVAYELQHLKNKLKLRDPKQLHAIEKLSLQLHPLFTLTRGDVEPWERT